MTRIMLRRGLTALRCGSISEPPMRNGNAEVARRERGHWRQRSGGRPARALLGLASGALLLLGTAGILPARAVLLQDAATPPNSTPAQEPKRPGTRLVLLGTGGGPVTHTARSQPASLLVVDGHAYLIDCGAGTAHQLRRAGIVATSIPKIFLTHLHFDHVAGLAPLFGFNWSSGKRTPMDVYGPLGTKRLVDQALGYLSLPEYLYALQLPPHDKMSKIIVGHDKPLSKPTTIYQDERVKVTAVENSHYATMAIGPEGQQTRSYSYRFDTRDRSIVFTGDTGPSEAVERLASGADILVSEIIDVDATIAYMRRAFSMSEGQMKALVDHQKKEHLVPEEVGKLAQRAKVKMVVLSHIAPSDDAGVDSLQYTAGVRRHFSGPVVLGRDLDQF